MYVDKVKFIGRLFTKSITIYLKDPVKYKDYYHSIGFLSRTQ